MSDPSVAKSDSLFDTTEFADPVYSKKNSPAVRTRKAVFPGKYIQAENALAQVPEWARLLGSRAMLLASPTVKQRIWPPFQTPETESWILPVEFRGECCSSEINRLSEIIRMQKIDVVIGMGGGKTIDTAKIIADKANIPVVIVPTIASTDAPCSGCAVIYTEEGVFESVYYQKMNPQVVLVDTTVIANAPVRYLVAGIGDALSTWFEARSCDRTQSMNECGGYSTLAGIQLAKVCYETILQYAVAAKMANEQHIVTPALNHIIEANTLLSGVGFESAGLAAAHAIHNGLTALEETHSFYHGEKVAFGVLTSLHLNDTAPDEITQVYTFCEKIGLPTSLSDLGVTNISREKLMPVALKACAPTESIHKEAGQMTPERVLQAMMAADAMGKMRKKHNPVS